MLIQPFPRPVTTPFRHIAVALRRPPRYHRAMTPDVQIDCEGLLCPLPVLRARKTLANMRPGQILRLTATDRMAAIDLPHFCTQAGHDFLGATEQGGITAYLIRRGA